MADKPKPKITRRCLDRMARRLARVGEDMRCLGADMDYYGGFGLIGVHGREMLGAAQMTKAWSSHIGKMAETLDGKANPADKKPDKTIPCRECQRVAVVSKSGKTYVCQTCGTRERIT